MVVALEQQNTTRTQRYALSQQRCEDCNRLLFEYEFYLTPGSRVYIEVQCRFVKCKKLNRILAQA